MTTPVTTAAPAVRPAPASDSGSSDSAEPFASALDGALGSAGRAEVDGTGAQAGGDQPADQEETATADGAIPVPAGPTSAPANVVAALWALLTGASTPSPAADAEAAGQASTAAVDALPRGLTVAQAHGGAAVAHGVHGTQPGQLRAGAPAAPADATSAPVPPTGGPTPPPPAGAAVQAAVDALAAAGISQIVAEAAAPGSGDGATAAPVALPVTTPATGDGAAAPVAAPPGTSGALPVAAPTDSGGTSADNDPGSGTGEDGAPGTDTVQTTGQPAPASSTAPVARPEATTGTAVEHPVSSQIARHVAVLRGGPDGSHTMTVVLTPDSLGPVEVSVTVSRGAVELTLRGAHEHGRAALLDAVPDLRRDLEAAGLTCSRLDVDRGSRDGSFSSSSQQSAGRPGDQGPGGRGAHGERPDGGARPWHRSADRGDGPRATTRTAAGLDVRV